MRKRPRLGAALVLCSLVAALPAQESDPRSIPLEAPKGWSTETIALPPPFAPTMKLRGVEEVRFAPGMFRADSDSFFTYVFAFRLDPGQALGVAAIRRETLVYYQGLAKAVLGDTPVDVSKFEMKLERRVAAGGSSGSDGVDAYSGEIRWIEPFVTKKAQTLRLEIDVWRTGAGRSAYVFSCVSPKPDSAAMWKEMRTVRDKLLRRFPPLRGRWPSFRGPQACGFADGQNLPESWDVAGKRNLLWKTPIPGLAHSSPISWGDRIFVTTAISSQKGATFRKGLYGDGDASKDTSSHRWMLYCVDRQSGGVLWKSLAFEGAPREKRHIKSTYANSSAATDGRYVVAFFGSHGLYAFDLAGKLLWKKDLGRLDVGAYDAPGYEWGTASSPIIYRDLVIVQCDTQGESSVLGIDLRSGKTAWKATRDELPSWGTPTICDGPRGPELVTNGSNAIRAYEPLTGSQLWTLGGSSKITAPTPIFDDNLIVVASGRAPERPIFAVRAGSRGDLTLKDGARSSSNVVWSKVRRGPYMPTPLAYRGRLYVLGNSGLFDCYDLESGEEIYRQRIRHGGSGFSASPVAADGRIYVSSEDGSVLVIRAGEKFELLGKIPMGEPLMATPAICSGALLIRGQHHLFAVGRNDG